MRWDNIIDLQELRKAIQIMKPDHELFEVRILGNDKRKILSGYFTDVDTLITAFDTVDLRERNVYFTLNTVNEALYSRIQHDKFVANVNTTTDTEISRYEWLFIDFDPERPANISSSDSELHNAELLMNTTREYLASIGFHAPVVAMSGNGYHLLYKIDLPCDNSYKQLLNDCLTALAALFNNKDVKIDVVNFNPARICKLYGTLSQKGASTQTRPHRMSLILESPDVIQVNDESLLRGLSEEIPEESKKNNVKPSRFQRQEFDIRQWLSDHGMTYKEDAGRDCQMFLLDECPFDPSHKNGDSKIFAYNNGAIAFKCHHNSCRKYRWQDVRLKYEPDAYDERIEDERIEAAYQKHKKQKGQPQEVIPLAGDPADKSTEKSKPSKKIKIRNLKTATALMNKELPELEVFVGVGDELPFLVEGTCILSAKPKLGKSWLALSMCVAIANGDDFLGYKTKQCSTLYLDLETSEVIQKKRLNKVLKGRPVPENFYLETETNSISNGFAEQIEAYLKEDPNLKVVVVDVFQIIRSPLKSMKESEYDHAYRDITPLNELAQKYHISIILVCHDRKSVDPDDPFSNILGSTGLQGAATQMIVMFRRKKEDPIHISVKGKTIDGLPDLDVMLQDAEWKIVDAVKIAKQEQEKLLEEYMESNIRKVVCKIINSCGHWKGRCGQVIKLGNEEYNIPIEETAINVGAFFRRHQSRFLSKDNIKLIIIQNGTGGALYEFSKGIVDTVDTVDENEEIPLIECEEPHEYLSSDNPFL